MAEPSYSLSSTVRKGVNSNEMEEMWIFRKVGCTLFLSNCRVQHPRQALVSRRRLPKPPPPYQKGSFYQPRSGGQDLLFVEVDLFF